MPATNEEVKKALREYFPRQKDGFEGHDAIAYLKEELKMEISTATIPTVFGGFIKQGMLLKVPVSKEVYMSWFNSRKPASKGEHGLYTVYFPSEYAEKSQELAKKQHDYQEKKELMEGVPSIEKSRLIPSSWQASSTPIRICE